MRRVLIPAFFWTPVVVGVGMMAYGIFEWNSDWFDRGFDWLQGGGIAYLVAGMARLLGPWPAGVLFMSGFEAGQQWQKKHARRGRFQVVSGKNRDQGSGSS